MSTLAATNLKHASSASNNIVLDTSGNVGIGTSSPSARLQAYGTSGTAQARLGTANGYLEVNAFDANPVYCVVNGASHTAAVFGSQSNTPTVFFTNNTERMRIDTSGNVGIGTSSPAAPLDVRSSVDTIINSQSTGTIQSAIVRIVGRQSSVDEEWNVVAAGSGLGSSALRFVRGVWTGTPSAIITSTGDFQFNSGYGSVATAYGCRAWVNFNGQGTVAIRASGNVTSITDNGVGDYTVNFTNAMPDTNYSFVGFNRKDNDLNDGIVAVNSLASSTKTTSAVRVYSRYRDNTAGGFGSFDSGEVNVIVMR